MTDWDEAWNARASRQRPGKRRAHIGWIFTAVLALMLAMLATTNWRHWTTQGTPLPAADADDSLQADFALCGTGLRATCVIDGDTIWFQGEKIRIADINAPEVSGARCDYELDLGRKATSRLVELLNAGPFSLTSPEARDVDRYGRSLRNVMRGGQSVGKVLVQEGLAEEWTGHRRNWCEGRG